MSSRYLKMLALATILYYAAVRLFQDFYYRGRFEEIRADFFEGFKPLPEPLEIPLYFLGFAAIPILAWCWDILWQRKSARYLAAAILAFGLIFAVWQFLGKAALPDPGIYFSYLENKGIGKAIWLVLTKRLYVLRLLVILSLIFFGIHYWHSRKRLSQASIPKTESPIWQKLGPWFLIFLAVLIFHPNFPYEEHHYNYVIGTLNDMASGKRFLYETMNQYGISNIYLLHGLFKMFPPLSYEKLSFVFFFAYYLFYAGVFFFVKKWLNSARLACLATLSVIAVSYFLQVSPTLSAYFYPGLIPFRYGFFIIALLLLAYQKKEWAIIASAFSVFWSLDSGIYLAIATFMTLWLSRQEKFWVLFGKLAAYVLAFFSAINFINFLTIGSWPNWPLYLKKMLFGAAVNPQPIIGFFEIYIFIYLGVMLWWLQRHFRGESKDPIVLFLAIYGIFSFTYYINNSEWNVLYHIATPLILIAFYFAKHYLAYSIVNSVFASFLVFCALIFAVKIPVEFRNRSYSDFGQNSQVQALDEKLRSDAQILSEKYGFLERVPLIHWRGTKLLVFMQKTNQFDFFSLAELASRQIFDPVIFEIRASKPEYLFVGNDENEQILYFKDAMLSDYRKIDLLNTLDVYKRRF